MRDRSCFNVCVLCTDYNQKKYIEDTLCGFCIQKTTFPYVCIIIDDASTDGTQNTINKYLSDFFDLDNHSIARKEETDDYVLTFAQHKSNAHCFFAVFLLKENHYIIRKSKRGYGKEWIDNSKYIALCEGDDFWINPNKLQKQFAYMEDNPNCGLVYTDVWQYIQEEDKLIKESWVKQSDYNDLLNRNCICTLTSFFKTNLYKRYFFEIKTGSNWLMGDYPLWLYISHLSDIKFLEDVTGVYRVLENSVSHSKDISRQFLFLKSFLEIRLFFCEKYSINKVKKVSEKSILSLVDFVITNDILLDKDVFRYYKAGKVTNAKLIFLTILSFFKMGVMFIKFERYYRLKIRM